MISCRGVGAFLLAVSAACSDDGCSLLAMPHRGGLEASKANGTYDVLLGDDFCQIYYKGTRGEDCKELRSLVKANHSRTLPTLELGDPRKPAMYFLHGWPDSAALWANQFEAFCAPPHGLFFCVAPTMYNFHPQMPTAPDEVLYWDKQVDALWAVAQEVGINNVTLVMHELGAVIGYQFVYRYASLVSRVISIDVGNKPLPHGMWWSQPLPLNVLPSYQQINIEAYLANDDALMRTNSNMRHSPCASCSMIQARIGWPYYQLIRGGNSTWQPRLEPNIPTKDWKFAYTPDFPRNMPVLFMYGKCEVGTGCKGCPGGETCVPWKKYYFSGDFIEWVATQPGGSRSVGIEGGRWISFRSSGENRRDWLAWKNAQQNSQQHHRDDKQHVMLDKVARTQLGESQLRPDHAAESLIEVMADWLL